MCTLLSSAATPNTKRILAILLPRMFPIAKFVVSLIAENMLTTHSGAEVPKAIMVSPITIGGMWAFFDNDDAPRTRASAPPTRITSPSINSMTGMNMGLFFFLNYLYPAPRFAEVYNYF